MERELEIDQGIYLVDGASRSYRFLRRRRDRRPVDAQENERNKRLINGYVRVFPDGRTKVFRHGADTATPLRVPDSVASTGDTYFAAPASGPGPGVLVIHSWWGLNPFFRGLCDRLAREGFVACAPDLYDGRVATTVAAARRLRARPRREATYRVILRAIAQLRGHQAVQGTTIGVIGCSMGAHWALWLSQRPASPIGAVVTFYGARGGDYTASRAAYLCHFAERDPWVTKAALRRFSRSLEAAGRDATFCVYPGARHWFFESDRADSYHPAAATSAWMRTLAMLRARLGP